MMGDYFKTLRESILEQQKKTDQKQDQLIEQLKDNQLVLSQGLKDIVESNRDIMTLQHELPQLDFSREDEDEEDELPEFEGAKITEIEEDRDDEKEKESSSTKKKPSFIDIDKGMNDDYKQLLINKGYDLPSKIFKDQLDVDKTITKVEGKIKSSEKYIEEHSTKKGEPLKRLSKGN